MRLIDLPKNVVVPGHPDPDERDAYSLKFCGGHGVIVLTIWTSEEKAKATLAGTHPDLPLSSFDRDKLIITAAKKKMCTHMYINPSAGDPVIVKTGFRLMELDQKRVVPLNSFEAIWPIYASWKGYDDRIGKSRFQSSVRSSVLEAGYVFIKETWKQNPHLSMLEAFQLASETVSGICDNAKQHANPIKHKSAKPTLPPLPTLPPSSAERASWPLARARMLSAGLSELTIIHIEEVWQKSPSMSLQEFVEKSLSQVRDAIVRQLQEVETNLAEAGFVYILTNPSIPGQVKIGHSSRSPEERARKLSNSSGVPSPFIVVYAESVRNCEEVEREIHRRLEHVRINPNREFFSIPIQDAITIVSDVASRYPR
jgi:hypothetical protein